MKRFHVSLFGATGLLLVVLSVPMTTAVLQASIGGLDRSSLGGGGHYSETLQEQVQENITDLKAARRALTRLNARCGRTGTQPDAACEAHAIVQKECLARQSKYDQDTGCPTINDMTRIEAVQKAIESKKPIPSVQETSVTPAHAAAASGSVTLDQLKASEQLAVRRAIRIQYCSPKMPRIMYLLCSAAVGTQQKAAPTGFGNDLQLVRTARRSTQPSTLMDRIEMTKPIAR